MSSKTSEVPGDLLVLDACCIINLAATGRMAEIMEATGRHCVVVAYVAREEALGLRTGREDPDERRLIDLAPLSDAGFLEVRELTKPPELREFVRFATVLDDGEAWTCALAKLEKGIVATDDRKTLRILGEEGISSVQTPDLLFAWAEAKSVPSTEIREALTRIERFASFRPRRQAPLYRWWRRHVPTLGET